MIAVSSKLENRPPKHFTASAVILISLFGLVLAMPVLFSMLVISLLQFGILTFLIPFTAIVLSIFLLPLGFGNPYIARLVKSLEQTSAANNEGHVVQLTRDPRDRHGLLAILEDADDFGFLRFSDTELRFIGDCIELRVPYNRVCNFKRQNSGWRALFAYGYPISLTVADLPEAGRFIFAERSSWILPTSRQNARRMYEDLRSKLEGARVTPAANHPGSD